MSCYPLQINWTQTVSGTGIEVAFRKPIIITGVFFFSCFYSLQLRIDSIGFSTTFYYDVPIANILAVSSGVGAPNQRQPQPTGYLINKLHVNKSIVLVGDQNPNTTINYSITLVYVLA